MVLTHKMYLQMKLCIYNAFDKRITKKSKNRVLEIVIHFPHQNL